MAPAVEELAVKSASAAGTTEAPEEFVGVREDDLTDVGIREPVTLGEFDDAPTAPAIEEGGEDEPCTGNRPAELATEACTLGETEVA